MRIPLALSAFAAGLLAQGTPTWVVNPANSREYAITSSKSWTQAEAEANLHGGHLATVRTAAENSWIVQTFGHGYWIGLTDALQEGVWAWSSGEASTYTAWCLGEPNNASDEDYAVITPCGWNDQNTPLLPGLIERPALPPGYQWKLCPGNGRWYTAGPTPTSWAAGEALAVSLGGHLATIRSAAEQRWIESAFASELGSHGLWIGLSDIAAEGQWVWTSGEPVAFTNWAPGQPDNGGGNEDAAHLWGSNAGSNQWKWNDETDTFSGILRPLIELSNLAGASFVQFGSGCPGPAGVPALAGVVGEPPRVGSTTRIRVSNLPVSVTVPIFVLGLSNTQDPGPPAYPLPLDLGILGWSGCSQLVSDDVVSLTITTSGIADYTLGVPMNLALVGFAFHAQALVLYSTSAVAASNGVTGVVGL
jgi:hypothetical protein